MKIFIWSYLISFVFLLGLVLAAHKAGVKEKQAFIYPFIPALNTLLLFAYLWYVYKNKHRFK